MPKREPLYPHIPQKKTPLFPHVPKGQSQVPHVFMYDAWVMRNGEDAMPAMFDTYGRNWLRWRAMFTDKDLYIEVSPVNLPPSAMAQSFIHSHAFFRAVRTEHDLPYAAAGRNEVFFLATIDGKQIDVQIAPIRGLTDRQIEDGFNNAFARMIIRQLSRRGYQPASTISPQIAPVSLSPQAKSDSKYLSTKWYLLSATEGVVLPMAFDTASKAFGYSSENKLVWRGYTGVKGEAVRRLIEKGLTKESTETTSLPQTAQASDRLDGLIITKAFKQISRHEADKISVSLQAWAIFPKGKRPHMITFYRDGDYYVVHPLYAHIREWVRIPVTKMNAWIKSLPLQHFEPMAVAPKDRERAEQLAREVDTHIDILDLYPSQQVAPSVNRDYNLGEVTLRRVESLFRKFVDEEQWFVAALRDGSIDSWNFNLHVWDKLPYSLFATRENEERMSLGYTGDAFDWQVIETYKGISLIKAYYIKRIRR